MLVSEELEMLVAGAENNYTATFYADVENIFNQYYNNQSDESLPIALDVLNATWTSTCSIHEGLDTEFYTKWISTRTQ